MAINVSLVLLIPIWDFFVVPLNVAGEFVKYLHTCLLFMNRETFQKLVVDGIYECTYRRAEHALVYVLEFILLVGNVVCGVGVMAGLCLSLQCICCSF